MHIEKNIEEYTAINVYSNISDGLKSFFLSFYFVDCLFLVYFHCIDLSSLALSRKLNFLSIGARKLKLKIINQYIFFKMVKNLLMVLITLISHACKRWKKKGGVWKNLSGEGWECLLWGNGATQSATCCTICKRDWVGIGPKDLRIVAAFWAAIPRSLSLDWIHFVIIHNNFTSNNWKKNSENINYLQFPYNGTILSVYQLHENIN